MNNPFKKLILMAAGEAVRKGDIVAAFLLFAVASQLPNN
jgi:hypothetical protein